jgi:tetratricopeptide (TPR) repeat protein
MLKKYVLRILQIGLAAMILGGFVAAQKAKKTPSAEGFYNRGAAQMEREDFLAAIENFDRAIRLKPGEAKFLLKRGECYYEIYEFEKAFEDYNRTIELKPDYVEAYVSRAIWYSRDYFRAENYRQAVADYEKAVSLNPNRAETYVARAGHFYLRPNCPEMAEGLADVARAIEINPRLTVSYFVRAEFYSRIDDYEKAIADTTTALKINPQSVYGFELRAGFYSELGNYQKAIADYTQVLKFAPNDINALYQRAEAYRQTGNFRLAAADERKVERLRKSEINPTMMMIGGRKTVLTEQELNDSYINSDYLETEKFDAEKTKSLPREEVEKLTKICFARANFESGNQQRQAGRYEQAIADYTAAIASDLTKGDYYNNRGITYAKKGDYDAALKDFKNAIFLNFLGDLLEYKLEQETTIAEPFAKSPPIYNRALVLMKKSEFTGAIDTLTAYLKIMPGVMKAYQLRSVAFRKIGKISEAEADEKMIEKLQN